MKITDFRQLDVYQRAFRTGMEIYELSKAWPADERFGMTAQIRDCSRSVCANIGEAWRKRRLYVAMFISKLSDAETEAAETVVWLEFAQECGFVSEAVAKRLINEYDHICAQLTTMMDQPEKRCPPEALARGKR